MAGTGQVRMRGKEEMSEFFEVKREARDHLVESGFSKDQVSAVVEAVYGARKGLATKQDLTNLQQVMATKTDVANLERNMSTRQDLAELKQELRQEMSSQRANDRWTFAVLWALMLTTNAALYAFLG